VNATDAALDGSMNRFVVGALLLLAMANADCSGATSPPPPAPARDAPAEDRVKGWESDTDHLVAEVRRQHYIYRSRPVPEAFGKRVREVKHAVPRYSDERMLLELTGLLALLGDGHSYVLPVSVRGEPTRCLPVQTYWFSDGLFVIDAEHGYERWRGRQITRFGRVSAADAMKRVADYTSRDNDMGVSWIGPFLLRFRGMLEVLGLDRGAPTVRLGYRTPAGVEAEEDIDFITVPRFRGVPKLGPPHSGGTGEPVLYLRRVAEPHWFERLDDGTLYVQFNQVVDGHDESLAVFARRLDGALNERRPRLLVVDVRHNNGGNAELLPPLVGVLKAYEAKAPSARLVVLTGRNTFSAAQIFIAQVDRETNAVFAGEMSSSKPNFVGEENGITLPWSRASGSISNRYHESIPGDRREGIEPDLEMGLSSSDYFGNRDVLLAAVRRTYGPPAGK
jgi:hypothetical protein